MPVLWRLGEATVEEIRVALPKRYRSAYNTVQTVLNRLSDRGLLVRERRGHAYVYRARLSETDYLRQSITRRLDGASGEARRAVLAHLVGSLDQTELASLRRLAAEVDNKRAEKKA